MWRMKAALAILRWWLKGATMEGSVYPTRWRETKFVWRAWRGWDDVTKRKTTGTITARYTPQEPRTPKGEDSTK